MDRTLQKAAKTLQFQKEKIVTVRVTMDVIFQPTRGMPFILEVGFFDTFSEIKEKIQKAKGIPVPSQTLVFNGSVICDDLNIHDSEILDRSQIQLILTPDTTENDCVNASSKAEQPLSSPSNKILLYLKMPNVSKSSMIKIEMVANDTIRKVKERIHEMEGLPIHRLVLHGNDGSQELIDSKTIQDYHSAIIDNNSEVEVSLRPSSSSSSGSSSGKTSGLKKLRVTIQTNSGRKYPLEVNPAENVAELRKELERMSQHQQVELPPEGYFFIHKQNVMDDDRSFRWHQVGQGDTIEIFNGRVTSGS